MVMREEILLRDMHPTFMLIICLFSCFDVDLYRHARQDTHFHDKRVRYEAGMLIRIPLRIIMLIAAYCRRQRPRDIQQYDDTRTECRQPRRRYYICLATLWRLLISGAARDNTYGLKRHEVV